MVTAPKLLSDLTTCVLYSDGENTDQQAIWYDHQRKECQLTNQPGPQLSSPHHRQKYGLPRIPVCHQGPRNQVPLLQDTQTAYHV